MSKEFLDYFKITNKNQIFQDKSLLKNKRKYSSDRDKDFEIREVDSHKELIEFYSVTFIYLKKEK